MNGVQVWHAISLALLLMEMLICKMNIFFFSQKKKKNLFAQENPTSNQFNFFFKKKN